MHHPLPCVYFAAHKDVPFVFKIGMTEKSLDQRMENIANTYRLSGNLDVVGTIFSEKPEHLERLIHKWFDDRRLKGTEFFQMSVDDAAEFFDIFSPFLLCRLDHKMLFNVRDSWGAGRTQRLETVSTSIRSRAEVRLPDVVLEMFESGQPIDSLSDLASKLGVSLTTLSRKVDQWSQAGLVEKVRVGKSITIEYLGKTQKSPAEDCEANV